MCWINASPSQSTVWNIWSWPPSADGYAHQTISTTYIACWLPGLQAHLWQYNELRCIILGYISQLPFTTPIIWLWVVCHLREKHELAVELLINAEHGYFSRAKFWTSRLFLLWKWCTHWHTISRLIMFSPNTSTNCQWMSLTIQTQNARYCYLYRQFYLRIQISSCLLPRLLWNFWSVTTEPYPIFLFGHMQVTFLTALVLQLFWIF